MVYENIDKLIAEAMKSKDNVRLFTLRLIKTKFLEYKTSKGAKPIDESIEISILGKMVNERKDSIEQYTSANRIELAEKEKNEMEIIKEFLPEDISEDMIINKFSDILLEGVEPVRKNMGIFIKKLKDAYPTADGKMIASIVSTRLN